MKNSNTRRFLLALAGAIAIHAIFAWLLSPATARPAAREIVSHVTIARIEPRPSPTPSPSPRPARTIAPVRVVTAPQPTVVPHTTTGKAARVRAAARIAAARPKPPIVTARKPLVSLPVGGAGAGAGNRTGAGSPAHGTGGSGAGTEGTGNGAASGSEPCGYVEFSDPDGSRYDPQTHGFWVDIGMSVHFADGRVAMLQLDYPWYYPSEAANPWSDQNLHDPNFITTFQFPPAGRRAAEPALVQYVMAHTSADGYTRLRDCPASP
ncbi:MAG TPA: hypothetical protein VJP76_00975 [Candidatus Tumulicola sp.]|nr:hypothetical protein [Candidatus Tumulicola sp.]